MKKLLFLAAFLLPLVSYAGKNEFIRTDGKPAKTSRAHKTPIVIYLDPNEIPDSLVRVGVILNTTKHQRNAFIQAQKLAQRHGAKAIFLQSGKDISGGGKVVNALIMPGAYKAKWVFYVYE